MSGFIFIALLATLLLAVGVTFYFKHIRFRHTFMVIGSISVILLYVLSDPDAGLISDLGIGAGTVAMLLFLVKGILIVTFMHLARKALHDYPEGDFQNMLKTALKSPVGAGLGAIAISIVTLSMAIVFTGVSGG